MTTGGLEFIIMVVAALTLFGGVLAWASWDEGRRERKHRLNKHHNS